jgi:hypothetical protein
LDCKIIIAEIGGRRWSSPKKENNISITLIIILNSPTTTKISLGTILIWREKHLNAEK